MSQSRGRQRQAPAPGTEHLCDCGVRFVGAGRCWACRLEERDERDERDREEAWKQGYDHGYLAGHRDGHRDGRADRPQLDADLLDRAIRLCHPDRHPVERADEANATTSALLNLRDKGRHGRRAA